MIDTDAKAAEPAKMPRQLRVMMFITLFAFTFLVAIRFLNDFNLYPVLAPFSAHDPAVAPDNAKSRDDVTELRLETADGVNLYGWRQGPEDAKVKVIYFQGNYEQVGRSPKFMADRCEELGAEILHFDYRGYGASEGRPSEQSLYADAREIYAYALKELAWQPEQIVIWGRSLGGAVAIRLASELVSDDRPEPLPRGERPCCLVIDSPFSNIKDMAGHRLGFLVVPHWVTFEGYDNLAIAPRLELPVFHFHGDQDNIAPVEMGRRIHAALPGPSEWLELEGVGHNDFWRSKERREMIYGRLREFLAANTKS
ncbi:MAG: alpha/beta hydrolase [Nitrospira sp.]|nr:alpha/beta hydrolase [Nitrospira sp.]